MPFVAPGRKLAPTQQNLQQAFSVCGNRQEAGSGEPQELSYSQAEISKDHALY